MIHEFVHLLCKCFPSTLSFVEELQGGVFGLNCSPSGGPSIAISVSFVCEQGMEHDIFISLRWLSVKCIGILLDAMNLLGSEDRES